MEVGVLIADLPLLAEVSGVEVGRPVLSGSLDGSWCIADEYLVEWLPDIRLNDLMLLAIKGLKVSCSVIFKHAYLDMALVALVHQKR